MKKNEVILSFSIYDFDDITHDEITKLLDIEPVYVHIKGQKRNPRNPENTALIKSNSWTMGSPLDKYSSFEDQMNSLLFIIESKMSTSRPG